MSYSCTTCGKPAGDTTQEGIFVHAGFGSRHDTSSFVWLVRGDDLPKPGILCDDCVDAHLAAGRLELIASAIGKQPGQLSEAANRELFAHSARRAYHDLWEQMADAPYHPCEDDEDLDDRIIAARNIIKPDCSTPEAVGRAHAAAALALRAPDNDPGFERAAWRWAAHEAAEHARRKEEELDHESLLAALKEALE